MKFLTIGIPTKTNINAVTFLSMKNIFNNVINDYTILFDILPGKSNIDQARSILITRWYDNSNDEDLFMFLDSDQTFELDDIKSLINLIIEKKADVSIGVYSNRNDKPTFFPVHSDNFFKGIDNNVLYAGTGFMMITKSILRKIEDYLRDDLKKGDPRFWVDIYNRNIIPFFCQRFVETEFGEICKKDWLGEDYAFCWLVRKVGGCIKGFISPSIGHEVSTIKFFYPRELLESREWSDTSIVYYLGNSIEWSPNDIYTKGLGGSETAVVYLSNYWRKYGYDVTVYGNVIDTVYNGVIYKHFTKFNINDRFYNIILWRSPGSSILPVVNSRNIFIDLHDYPSFILSILLPNLNKITKIFVKSNFHKSNFISSLSKTFSNIQFIYDKVIVLENGIDIPLFNDILNKNSLIKRNMKKILYASCYQRGLIYMLKYGYDYIKKNIPDIEFHLYYGVDLVKDENFIKEINTLIEEKGIINHGRISQPDLIREKLSAGFHYYMCTFPEIDCISIKESLYCGCIPVVSNIDIFNERSEYLNIIRGNPKDLNIQLNAAKFITDIILGIKKKPELRIYPFKSWEDISLDWLKEINPNKRNILINFDLIRENFTFIDIDYNVEIFKDKLEIFKNIIIKDRSKVNQRLFGIFIMYYINKVNTKNNLIIVEKNFKEGDIITDINSYGDGIYFFNNYTVIKNISVINDINFSSFIRENNIDIKDNKDFNLIGIDRIVIYNDNSEFYVPILNNLKRYINDKYITLFNKIGDDNLESLMNIKLKRSKNTELVIEMISEFMMYNFIMNSNLGKKILVIKKDDSNNFFRDCNIIDFWDSIYYYLEDKSKFIGIDLDHNNNSIIMDYRYNHNLYYVNLDNISMLLGIIKESNYEISRREFDNFVGKIRIIGLKSNKKLE